MWRLPLCRVHTCFPFQLGAWPSRFATFGGTHSLFSPFPFIPAVTFDFKARPLVFLVPHRLPSPNLMCLGQPGQHVPLFRLPLSGVFSLVWLSHHTPLSFLPIPLARPHPTYTQHTPFFSSPLKAPFSAPPRLLYIPLWTSPPASSNASRLYLPLHVFTRLAPTSAVAECLHDPSASPRPNCCSFNCSILVPLNSCLPSPGWASDNPNHPSGVCGPPTHCLSM